MKIYWTKFDEPVMRKDPFGNEFPVTGEYTCDHDQIKRCWVTVTLPVLIDELGPDEHEVQFHAETIDGHILSCKLWPPHTHADVEQQATDFLKSFYE